jgi:hypothetical protein
LKPFPDARYGYNNIVATRKSTSIDNPDATAAVLKKKRRYLAKKT